MGQSAVTTLDLPINGLSVSHAWLGDHATLFIELGDLSTSSKARRDGTMSNPTGEVSIQLYGDWRLEAASGILGGNRSARADALALLDTLIGRKVVAIHTVGRLPEIYLTLEDDYHLASFTPYEGDPDWSIADRRNAQARWFDVRKGVLSLGGGGPTEMVR